MGEQMSVDSCWKFEKLVMEKAWNVLHFYKGIVHCPIYTCLFSVLSYVPDSTIYFLLHVPFFPNGVNLISFILINIYLLYNAFKTSLIHTLIFFLDNLYTDQQK